MKRLIIVPSLLATVLLTTVGCGPDSTCCHRSNYCDDSGCFACDDSGCWPVPNDPCVNGLECGADEVCTDYGCARVCSFDTDCAAGEACLQAGYCGPAQVDGDPCAVDDDCTHGMICEDNVCVTGCQSDDECSEFGEGWVCTSCGRCQPPEQPTCGEWKILCETNEECGAGRLCTELARCAYTCDETSPVCPLGQVCAAGVCVEDPDPAQPQCLFSSDCSTQAACTDNGCLCVNTYCRSLCDTTTDCGWGELCDMGLCVPNYRPGE